MWAMAIIIEKYMIIGGKYCNPWAMIVKQCANEWQHYIILNGKYYIED